MNEREELAALRRMAELEAKARGGASPKFTPANATDDMPLWEQIAAGGGKAIFDAGRGIRQLASKVGIGDEKEIQAEIDEAKKRDEALMDTGGGLTGNILGNVGMALAPGGAAGAAAMFAQRMNLLRQYAPLLFKAAQTMAMPNTIKSAAAVGGAYGAAQPVASDESRLKNIGWGAGGGAGGIVAGRAVDAGVRGGRALVEPFTQGGRERILGRTLNRFAGNADDAARALQSADELVPGSIPTVGEASGDAGLSGLQLAAANADPKIKAALAMRAEQNNAARLSALRSVGKDDAAMAAARELREAEAKPLYEAAKGVMVQADDDLSALLNRPSMKGAWARAQKLAQENGETLTLGVDAPASKVTTGILDAAGNEITRDTPAQAKQYSGRALHYVKMALDDLSDPGVASGIGKNEQRAIAGTRDKLLGWMDEKIPEYGAARATYAAKSQPVNEMEYGQELLKRIQPALMDVAGVESPTRMRAETFAGALRDADQAIKRATGKNLDIDQVLTPESKGKVFGVAKDLGRKALSEDRAKTIGSTTAQNLGARNILRQTMGPLGLPESWSESMLALTAARPLNFAYKIPEAKLQDELAALLLDAKRSGRLMQSTRTRNLSPEQLQKLEQLARLLSASPAVAGMAGAQSRE